MLSFKHLELSELLDLLIEHTSSHTQMISRGGTTDELEKSRGILEQLQLEIKLRGTLNTTPRNVTDGSQDQTSKEISN